MKKSLIVLLSLFSISVQAKTLDDYGKMTVAEFSEYLVNIPTNEKVIDEVYTVLVSEYGDNKMSEKMLDVFWTYRDPETVKNCKNPENLPRKQQDFFKKHCSTKISKKVIEPMEQGFRKLGWLR